jgi:hypothetical protein
MHIFLFDLARDSAKHETIVHLLETRQKQDLRNLARNLNDFRAMYQQSKDAREYDLNDTSMSTIVYDNDSNRLQYGLGSCLFFEGEDRNKQDREKIQKEQMNRWITEQVFLINRFVCEGAFLFSAVKNMKLCKNNKCSIKHTIVIS